jgi:uncharacterized protein (TIGR03437 family)
MHLEGKMGIGIILAARTNSRRKCWRIAAGLVPAILAGCLLAQVSPLWAASNWVNGIDIVVKKKPGGSLVVNSQSDGAGRVRLAIADPGDYTIVATQSTLPTTTVGLTLKGNFTLAGTAPSGPLVTGPNLNGASLIAAGSTGPGQEVIFSVDITVNAPVSFSGQFFADADVTASTNHLTFYAIANGAAPLPQTVQILNNSTNSVSYTASVETLASQWAVNLSPLSGTVAAAVSAPIAVAPSVQGLPAGTYSALLQIAEQASGVTTQQVVGLTMVVSAPGATDGTIGFDQVMAASYPQSGGMLEPAVFTVSNQDASTQTYTVAVDPATGAASDASIQPAQFTLTPGQSQPVQVQAASAKSLTFLIAASSGATAQVSNVALGASTVAGACLPTQMLPVVSQVDSVARSGYPLNVTLQAYDDCGNSYSDFTTGVSIGNGTTSAALGRSKGNVQAVWSRAAGVSSFTVVSPCCSYIPAVPGHMSLTIGVQAVDPLGGDPLSGSVTLPVAYEIDPAAPIISEGGIVSAASFEPVATAPLEIFSLFGVFPGLTPASATTLPFATTLGNVQVLIDGEAAPLYYVSANQVNAIFPADLLPGPHNVAALYNGVLSGSTTIMMGLANPAPFTANGAPIMTYADGSLVTPSKPAQVGDTLVMWVDGLGLSNVPVQAGSAAPPGLSPAAEAMSVMLNGVPQNVLYAGFSPGSASLYQINFTVTSVAVPPSTPVVGEAVNAYLNIDGISGASEDVGPTTESGGFIPNSTASTFTLSFQASYPDAQFYVNNQLYAGNTGVLTFNSGTQIPLNVPPDPQQPSPGTQYYFGGWSQGGNRSQTIAPAGSAAVAAYFLASYLLTVNGTATENPTSPNGYYTQTAYNFIPVTVTGSCPSGELATGLLVASPNGSVTVANGSAITMDSPKTVFVQCATIAPLPSCAPPPQGMIAWYSLDETVSPAHDIAPGGGGANANWVGNPTPIAGEVAGALSFNGSNQWVQAVNSTEGDIGTGDMSADAWVKTTSTALQEIIDKFQEVDSSPGVTGSSGYLLGLTFGLPTVIFADGGVATEWTPPAGSVADGKWHHVAVTIARSSTTGGTIYVDGVATLVFDPTNKPGSWSSPVPLTIGGPYVGSSFNGAIDEVEVFNRALSATEVGQIYAAGSFGKCKPSQPAVTDTVTTVPANLQVTIDGGTPVTAPQTVSWVPSTSHTLGAPSPQLDAAGDTQYTLSATTPWTATAGAITSSGNVASAPATSSTYTATFNTAYQVTLVLNGCTVSQTNVPGLGAGSPVFVAADSAVNVTVSPTSPNVFQSIAAVPSTNATVTSDGISISSLTAPVAITATCAPPQNVTLTVATNPAGLMALIGTSGPYAPAPITQQVPPNQTETVSVTTPQFVASAGTGYSFTGWSTGASTPTTTVQPASNFTATANFAVACYTLTINAQPAAGGITTFNVGGGLSGLPANCYAPGTVVTLNAFPAPGYIFQGWTGGAVPTGTGNGATVTVNGPTTVTANFSVYPAPNLNFGGANWGYTSANAFRIVGGIGNNGVNYNNVMVTQVVWTAATGTGSIADTSALPIAIGNLASGTVSPNITLTSTMPNTVTSFTVCTSGTAVVPQTGVTVTWMDNQNCGHVFPIN